MLSTKSSRSLILSTEEQDELVCSNKKVKGSKKVWTHPPRHLDVALATGTRL